MTLRESEERTLLAALVAGLFLLLGGPIGYNPDGLEMIALARSWRGELPTDPASGYWPPLWPALVGVAAEFASPEQAGRLLNLAVAGLTAGPLHLLASGLSERLGGKMLGRRVDGRNAGRLAVALYALLPSVLIHAPVLDARPLGSFLLCSCAAWALKAEKRQEWAIAGFCGMLASLARPEGLALLPILALAAFLQGQRWNSLLLLSGMLPALLRPGSRGWESFTGPWLSIWPTTDLLALYGPSSLPTGYREFVLRAKEVGIEQGEIPLSNLIAGIPEGLKLLMEGLPGALGGLGTILGVVTILELCSRGWRTALLTAAGSSLVGVLVLLPMARDQATPATNFGFVVPVACALVGLLLMALGGRQPLLAVILGVGMEMEARYGPFRVGTPWFCEGTDASRTMRLWLQEHPPASGRVACRMAGRGVVIAAGLQPLSLPSSWEQWEAPPETGVLLASADLQGADGGRGLELLQDPRWQVEMLSFEGQSSYWEAAIGGAQQGRPPPTLPPQNHWMIYLEPRP